MFKICFIVPSAYSIIDPSLNQGIGGWETRSWLFARGLVGLNEEIDVSFVLRTSKKNIPQTSYDGIKIIHRAEPLFYIRRLVSECVEVKDRFPWLSIRNWETSLLWNIPLLAVCRPFRKPTLSTFISQEEIAKINADFYCCFGVSSRTAAIGDVVHSLGKKMVLFLGSMTDLDERYQPGSTFVNASADCGDVCYQAIMNADVIVAQNEDQQKLLEARFNRESICISNPIDVSRWDGTFPLNIDLPDRLPEKYVLWVGRSDYHHKRPLLCLELPNRFPDIHFLMIVNPYSQEVENKVQLQSPENVTIIPRVHFSAMPKVMACAKLFVTTSAKTEEGFPNVLLQAACAGVPIASLEVSEEFISEANAGFCANSDMEQLGNYIQAVWNSPDETVKSSHSATQYVLQHHGYLQQSKKLAACLVNDKNREDIITDAE